MQPRHDDGVTLTSFDERIAAAVVTVLTGAGVPAWTAPGEDGDVAVRVGSADRDRAMRELGARMEEVREAAGTDDAPDRAAPDRAAPEPLARAAPQPSYDVDDPADGPPLVMERLRSMRYLGAAVLAPLLVVTLAPTLRGSTARLILGVLMAVAVVGLLIVRNRR